MRQTTGMAFVLVVGISGLPMACSPKNQSTPPATASKDRLTELQESLSKAPSFENHIALGLELARLGRSEEAIFAYQKAAEINPQAPIAYNNICAELNTQKKFADAIENCEKAIALEPQFALAKNNLAFAQTQLAEARQALLKRKSEILAKPGLTSQDILNAGMDFYAVRELSVANEIWQKIKKEDPLYATAKNNLASSYLLMNQIDKAEKALNEALSLDPNNPLFLRNRTWLESKKKTVK